MSLQRVISRIDFKSGFVVKGINFEGLRQICRISELRKFYNLEPPSELMLIGAASSLHSREISLTHLKEFSNLFCPLTVGGGIRSLDHVYNFLDSGADRVFFNTALDEDEKLLKQAIHEFGASTIVVGVDVDKVNGEFQCFKNNGRENTE